MADQSWRDRPAVMDRETWKAAARRMVDHARVHNLPSMRLILHGGEPLLAGSERLATLVGDFRVAFDGHCQLDVWIQTNGTLLDSQMLGQIRELEVRVGVSLDGGLADNDRHRRYADGRSSFPGVDRALRLLGTPEHRPAFGGVLCVVDAASDPVRCYEALLAYEPRSIDFLLPYANWSAPPSRPGGDGSTPYGDWLVAVFDRWYDAVPLETDVHPLLDIMVLMLDGDGDSEHIGLSPVAVVVVETDGAIEQADSLKSTYQGACATGLTVFKDSFDAALNHPGVVARQIGRDALSETCLECPVHKICGGGHYAHRFRTGEGFRNPSVYSPDLRRLIEHVTRRAGPDLRDRLRNLP
jgi:uncharacterized protein